MTLHYFRHAPYIGKAGEWTVTSPIKRAAAQKAGGGVDMERPYTTSSLVENLPSRISFEYCKDVFLQTIWSEQGDVIFLDTRNPHGRSIVERSLKPCIEILHVLGGP